MRLWRLFKVELGILFLRVFGKLMDFQEKINARAEWESHFKETGRNNDNCEKY